MLTNATLNFSPASVQSTMLGRNPLCKRSWLSMGLTDSDQSLRLSRSWHQIPREARPRGSMPRDVGQTGPRHRRPLRL